MSDLSESVFVNKIKDVLETNSREKIQELCKIWTEMFGQGNQYALEMQLGPMVNEFFSDILAQNVEVEKTLTDGIEGKFS
jgi:hypothetical protein